MNLSDSSEIEIGMAVLVTVFLVGFFLGVVAVVGLEVLGVWFLIRKLTQKNNKLKEEIQAVSKDVDLQQPLEFASNKEGEVWILEADKVPKTWLEKVSREQERKKKFFEVYPVRKLASIEDYCLILKESDGSHSQSPIPLKGCSIEAVSATDESSKKWAKKFPIKLESKTCAIYHGSKTLYIYLETSWEKESWCKALRYASSEDKKPHSLASKSQEEFEEYVKSLRDGYLSFMKPQVASHYEPISKEIRMDDASSKVRLMWKKISRKVSKAGVNEKSRAYQDYDSASGSGRAISTIKAPKSSTEDNNSSVHSPFSMSLPRSASHSQFSTTSDADSEERLLIDEGTLSLNLLISRLFFDIKSSEETIRFVQDRIQRTLSNMRIPSYIGEIKCTNINPGTLPPYIHSMKVLPLDINGVWAFEIDFEYSGGLVLEIETRVDTSDLDLNEESNTDLLEGLEQFEKQFDLPEGKGDELEHKEGELGDEGLKGTKSNTPTPAAVNTKSRWKSIVNSIARHVSQVPISMRISVASLRGTLRVHMKPPPSDQLWYSFTSMPDIDFNLDSALGEHKITSGHIALFLVNRFKAAIRETMVLPNCESLCIPFMLAEKNDWVPRKSAPFIWLNQESSLSSSSAAEKPPCSQPCEPKPPSIDHSKESVECGVLSKDEPAAPQAAHISDIPELKEKMQELTVPLLTINESQEDSVQNEETTLQVSEAVPRSISLQETPNSIHLPRSVSANSNSSGEDDSKLKGKLGRKARILGLTKKVGEKLEEKRRNIEEKGRNIVEKMRGPS